MPFISTTAGRITVSGTETSLAGLSTTTDVTNVDLNGRTIYTVASTRNFHLAAGATLTINPFIEQLIILSSTTNVANSAPLYIAGTSGSIAGGIINIGTIPENGVFPSGLAAIEFGSTSIPWFAGAFASTDNNGSAIMARTGSTINWQGGTITGAVSSSISGGLNISDEAAFVVRDEGVAGNRSGVGAPGLTTGQNYLQRFLTAPVISALAMPGGSISLGSGSQGSRISIDRTNAGTGYWPQYVTGRTTPVTVFDSNFVSNTVDMAVYSRIIFLGENLGTGSATTIRGGEQLANPTTTSGNNNGYNILYRTIKTDITNLSGNNIPGYLFIRDRNNGSRKNLVIGAITANDTQDAVYDFTVDGSIQSATAVTAPESLVRVRAALAASVLADSDLDVGEPLVHTVVATIGDNIAGTNNFGPYLKDFRGNSGNVEGTQTFDAHFWSYESPYQLFIIDCDDGNMGSFDIAAALVPDINTTMTLAQVTAAWNNQLTITAALLTVNGAITLDQLYDFTKYRKVTDSTLREVPSAGAMILSGNLGTIDLGATNLTLTAALTTGVTNTTITTTGDINAGGNDISGIYNFDHITNLAGTTNTTLNPTSTNTIELSNFDETHTNLTISSGLYSTSNEATFTGGTIGSVVIGGTGNLLSTDTAYSNTNITATGTKTFTGTTGTPDIGNSAGLTLVDNEWTSGSSIALTTGILNLNGGSYTTALTGTITTAQTWAWNNTTANSLTFDISALSISGIITINTNNTASLTEAQRWVAAITDTTKRGMFNVPAPSIDRNILVTVPTASSGMLTVRNTTLNTNSMFMITSGAVVGTLPTISSADTNSYSIYYKLNSTVGGATYRTRIIQVPSGTADILVEPLLVNAFFTDGAEDGGALELTIASSSTADIIGTFGSGSAAAVTTRATSQGAAIEAANDIDYFNWIVSNELTIDPIDYQPAAVLFNDAVDGITTTTNRVIVVSNVNTAQTVVNNWNGVITNDTGGTTISAGAGVRQVFNLPIGEADISTVTTAVSGTINAGLISFWTTHAIGRGIRRAIGYLVSGLASRIPRRSNYDNTGASDNDYLNNL